MMTRTTGIGAFVCLPLIALSQGGDKELRTKADALFAQGEYAQAMPLYSQLVSLDPADRDLSFRYGACSLYGGEDKEKAIGFLKYATEGPSPAPLAWYFLGKAYHLTYHFSEALAAYEHYRGTADRKVIAEHPVDALEQQCRNGKNLLSNLKEIEVHNKVEVSAAEFFRFYDLGDIGGKIVVTPDELRTSLDKKSKEPGLIYLPTKGGPIYFSSLGKDGRTGRDIYRTELLPTGEFATPVKLAGYINTDQDEDFACMAPDGKSFYFSSKGHNSMGGYDVFKSTYDKASDVFGPPENMDFAVNTPDDDQFYLVDAEGKEACFASGRDSRQGMLHVYRVGTTQAPINITVLKGTYSSQLDPADRKAHITVEDALTREQVAEVNTDINGSYVLALPRNGRYKFMVQAGPGGRTHAGMVEVPRNDQPRAYRQEMVLIDQGGEKLMIKNYFDEPLEEDIIALALEEIKRRARLDVTGTAPVAQAAPAEAPKGDVMTRAGFTGDRTLEDAVRLAKEDAATLDRQAAQEGEQAKAAYAIALEQAAQAEQATERVTELLARAEAATDDATRNDLMMQAARERRRSREANTRARTAYRTAGQLETERLATQQRTVRAAKLSTDLEQAVKGGSANEEATLTALTALKARIEERDGPEGRPDAAERARRAATEKEKEAAKRLQQANARRDEDNELTDRIGRLKHEQAEAKGAKKDELGREIAQLSEQQGFLAEEVKEAFAKADEAEREAVLARGQASLMDHLEQRTAAGPTAAPDEAQVSTLGQRIGATDMRIAAAAIDERYDADIAAGPEGEARQHLFDWGSNEAVADQSTTAHPTEAAHPAGDPSMRSTTVTATASNEPAQAQHPTTVPTRAQETRSIGEGTADARTASQEEKNGANNADGPGTDQPLARPVARSTDSASRTVGTETASVHGIATPDTIDADAHAGTAADQPSTTDDVPDPEERSFLLANQLAELHQLRTAEKDPAKRDSLDQVIASVQERMHRMAEAPPAPQEALPVTEETQAAPLVLGEEAPGLVLAALEFDPARMDSLLVEDLFPGFLLDRQRIAAGEGDARERAQALHGLEMMLVDSIDAQVQRQLAVVGKAPDQAAIVLPRVDRLRLLKEAHLKEAETILSEAEGLANGSKAAAPATPHNDGYISIAPGPDRIYESLVDHRSPKVAQAVVQKDKDLERLVGMEETIDSLEAVIDGTPAGKQYDKLRQRTDRLIDDHFILRTELGQRMGHLMRDEFATAKDSAAVLAQRATAKGLPTDDPLMRMAGEMEATADTDMATSADFRKRAERTEDIVLRDSLYRHAYRVELDALRRMDRALTVRNYMLRDDFHPGQEIAYAEIERRLFNNDDLLGTWAAPEGTPAAVVPPAPVRPEVVPAGEDLSSVPVKTTTDQAVAPGHPTQEVAMQQPSADALPPAPMQTEAAAHEAREQEQRTAARLALKEHLDRYYFLSVEEQQVVLNEEDHSRYFQAKTRSLDQRSKADADLAEADANTRQAAELKQQAAELRRSAAAGTVEQRVQEAERSEQQADRLAARADSLRNSAQDLDKAAAVNDSQAAVLLQGLPEDRSTAIMAMEQRTRRPGSTRTRPMAPPAESTPIPEGKVDPVSPVAEQPIVRTADTAAAPIPQPTGPERTALTELPVRTAMPETEQPKAVPAIAADSAPVASAPVAAPPAATVPAAIPNAAVPLAADVFSFSEAPARRDAPIAVDVPMPQGLVFKVQVGAFKREVDRNAFNDMTPVTGERTANGLIRYTAGMFTNAESATKASQQVRERGYHDAFVVAYLDGKRIPLQQARRLAQGLPATAPAEPAAVRPPVQLVSPVPSVASASPAPATAAPAPTGTEGPDGYPASAEKVLAAFRPTADAAAYYNDPTAAPARQVETVKGLFFTVQVGVYSRPTPLDRLFNISPLNSERTETGKIRYTTGIFLDLERAKVRKDGTVALGVTDAFVTAYLNGKRIPLRDARALLARFGTAVLADPSLATP